MNPLALHLQNYGVFRDETIALPEGLVGILGEIRNGPGGADSNGAGKSTMISALVACLFGVEPGRPKGFQTFAPEVTYGEDCVEIELTFEQGNELYRVRRTFTVKGGAKLDFEVATIEPCDALGLDGNHYEPLTRESATATQDLIDRTIGFSRSMFLASVIFPQKGETFPTGKRAMELLADVAFGLEPSWPVYAKRASDERKAFEVELQQLEGRTQAARELVATRPELEREHESAVEAETVAADMVADREREHIALAERWQEAREQDARRKTAEAELREAQSIVDALAERTRVANEAAQEIVTANGRLSELGTAPDTVKLEARIADLSVAVEAFAEAGRAHDAGVRELQHADRERAELGNRAGALRDKAETLRIEASMLDARPLDDGATCTHCGQVLGFEARERALKSYRDTAAALDVEAAALRQQAEKISVPVVPAAPEGDPPTTALAAVQGQYRAAQEAQGERARLSERVGLLEASAASRPSPEDTVTAVAARTAKQAALAALVSVDLASIEFQGGTVKAALDAAKAALDTSRAFRARLDERRVQMAAAEQALAEAVVKHDELHRALDTRVRLEKACGLNGIPALILETAVIPFMEAQTAAALSALNTPWQVELRTQREKKDGGLADTLDIVVQTENGDTPYWKLSGGEEMRIAIALRVALSALMPGRSGIFVIDEPRWLDAAGVEALIESLRGLLGRYMRVYVVTQSGTALRDSFDQVLTVVKDGGRSRVEGAAVAEPVEVAA